MDTETHDGLTRRQIVKAGAWAAPVVVLATATPASAVVQSSTLELGFTNVTSYAHWGNGGIDGIDGNTEIEIAGNGTDRVTSVTVIVIVDSAGLTETPPLVLEQSDARWSRSATCARNGDNFVYTFVWAGDIALYGNTGVLNMRLYGESGLADLVGSKTFLLEATSPTAQKATYATGGN